MKKATCLGEKCFTCEDETESVAMDWTTTGEIISRLRSSQVGACSGCAFCHEWREICCEVTATPG
jgi:hypothetical protein